MSIGPIPATPTQITPMQIARVRATLPRLIHRPALSATAFRMHLSRYAPALSGRVPLSPVALLADAVAVLDQQSKLLARVAPPAHTLRALGITPRDYVALHAALVDMVSEHLRGDQELAEAWSDVIGHVLATMLAEAHGIRITGIALVA